MEISPLTYSIGECVYGLPEEGFQMFLSGRTLGPRPVGAAPVVAGTFTFAGDEFRLIDLRTLFLGRPHVPGELVSFVGVRHSKGNFGLIVDALYESVYFPRGVHEREPDATIYNLPAAALPYVSSVLSGHSMGVLTTIYLLNLEAILAPETLLIN